MPLHRAFHIGPVDVEECPYHGPLKTHPGYLLRFPFDANFIAALRSLPSQARFWVPSRTAWWVRADCLGDVRQFAASLQGGIPEEWDDPPIDEPDLTSEEKRSGVIPIPERDPTFTPPPPPFTAPPPFDRGNAKHQTKPPPPPRPAPRQQADDEAWQRSQRASEQKARDQEKARRTYEQHERRSRNNSPGTRPSLQNDPWRTLHLLPSAPFEVVIAVRRALVVLHHPDRTGDPKNDELAKVNAAFDEIKKLKGDP